ncbi:MAG TPA: ABC transporter permease [Vicinamibacterales bacterium]|nr:ABC transporter permease [Vicinamibacterales bacterium]
MSILWQDVLYALRMLRASRSFAIVAVLTLALGIGANTAIFTLINAVFLNRLPVAAPDRLVTIYTSDSRNAIAGANLLPVSYPNFKDYRDRVTGFEGLAGAMFSGATFSDDGGESSEQLPAALVTANFFDVLGVRAVVGRTLRAGEDQHDGGDTLAILSYSLWHRRYHGDPNVVGKTVLLNGQPFSVIGVTAPGFKGIFSLSRADWVWVPMSMNQQLLTGLGREIFPLRRAVMITTVGRLAPGVTLAQAQQSLDPIAAQLEHDYPKDNGGRGVAVRPLEEGAIGINQRSQFVLAGTVLMTVAGFVLLIACANLASLLLARSSSREREIAVRAAIGAGRGRIVRQLLTESLVLAALGAIAALVVARLGRDALWALRPPFLTADSVSLTFDGRVLVFTVLTTIVTALVFGTLPAIRASRPDLVSSLKQGGRSGGLAGRGRRLRSALVVLEMAVALVALAGAGLFVRSLSVARQANLGFEGERLVVANLNPPSVGFESAQAAQYYKDAVERLRALPGVENAAVAQFQALGGGQVRSAYPEGQAVPPGQSVFVTQNLVSPSYFATLGIPLVRGRLLTDADTAGTQAVAVVNEAMAAKYWSGQDAIGQRFAYFNDTVPKTIVGIVRNSTIQQVGEEPRPVAYQPIAQFPPAFASVHVRTAGAPGPLVTTVQRTMDELDRRVAVSGTATIATTLDQTLYGTRMGATLLGVFAALALGLAAVGIYGVLAYSVNERTAEIGLRLALGAAPRDVLWLVVRDGLILAAGGVVVGLAASYGLGRFVATLLYDVPPSDPLTLASVAIVLVAVSLAACLIPCRRAMKVSALTVLR